MSSESDADPVSWRVDEGSHAFLLRAWQEPGEDSSERSTWRFSLTHIDATRLQRGFADLEDLVAYLIKELETME
jgi:hypothetical protein